jgi:hypothetical protein
MDKEVLTKIREWAESSHSYLSTRTDYACGYKDAMTYAKDIVLSILNNRQ